VELHAVIPPSVTTSVAVSRRRIRTNLLSGEE
jgi:hypothetical protein